MAWQRAEFARVSEALAARGAGGVGPLALIRPLTITRFVEISGQLLNTIMRDAKLNNDNYVAKVNWKNFFTLPVKMLQNTSISLMIIN